jgi:murein L,D-transpeptidase YcbB/YkuD
MSELVDNHRRFNCLPRGMPTILHTRRGFVGLFTSALVAGSAGRVIASSGAEWRDTFDTGSGGAADVRTSTPILSPAIVQKLQGAIAQYTEIVSRGGWGAVPAGKPLRLGVRDPAVALLRDRLAKSGDLPPSPGVPEVFDSYVDTGVKRFQARHGIQADGVVGDTSFAALNVPANVRLAQLATNLTRLRLLTGKLPSPRFVTVNIPGASVEAVENGSVASRHIAVVGKIDRPSPLVNSRITDINFHPYWTVPASIIKKDLIPMVQKDPDYLTRFRIRIYDAKGVQLDPAKINWNSDEATRYMFRQDPFEENSLGTVKINFPSPQGVYMHDTPHKGLFIEDTRFDSSGCVRVQNIRELIVWLLRDTAGWSRDKIDAELRGNDRRDVTLKTPVPLFWIYVTAWATTDGVVNFRDDIYRLDGLEAYTASVPAAPI